MKLPVQPVYDPAFELCGLRREVVFCEMVLDLSGERLRVGCYGHDVEFGLEGSADCPPGYEFHLLHVTALSNS